MLKHSTVEKKSAPDNLLPPPANEIGLAPFFPLVRLVWVGVTAHKARKIYGKAMDTFHVVEECRQHSSFSISIPFIILLRRCYRAAHKTPFFALLMAAGARGIGKQRNLLTSFLLPFFSLS